MGLSIYNPIDRVAEILKNKHPRANFAIVDFKLRRETTCPLSETYHLWNGDAVPPRNRATMPSRCGEQSETAQNAGIRAASLFAAIGASKPQSPVGPSRMPPSCRGWKWNDPGRNGISF